MSLWSFVSLLPASPEGGCTRNGTQAALLCLRQNRTTFVACAQLQIGVCFWLTPTANMSLASLLPQQSCGRRLHARRLLQGTSFSFAESRSLLESLRSTVFRSLLLASRTTAGARRFFALGKTAPCFEACANRRHEW
jgi:hypothetical protein